MSEEKDTRLNGQIYVKSNQNSKCKVKTKYAQACMQWQQASWRPPEHVRKPDGEKQINIYRRLQEPETWNPLEKHYIL